MNVDFVIAKWTGCWFKWRFVIRYKRVFLVLLHSNSAVKVALAGHWNSKALRLQARYYGRTHALQLFPLKLLVIALRMAKISGPSGHSPKQMDGKLQSYSNDL